MMKMGEYSTGVNITSDVKAIPLFTDTGTEEVNQANIILIANNGKYITSGNIIDQFDRIRIEVKDIDDNTYDRYFEVAQLKPSETNNEGTLLELECWGIEYYLNKIHYVKPHWFTDSATVGNDIINVYNSNILTARQPTVSLASSYTPSTQFGNDLPTWNVNHYEYGLNEDTCLNRLNDIYDKIRWNDSKWRC